jgi:hypothetical protein
MSTIRRMVCLANSRKVSGRCIAGKEILADAYGAWMRPVSARPSGEISEEERRYEDGTSAQVLDIIDIPAESSVASGHQIENCLIDPHDYWTRAGVFSRSSLRCLIDRPNFLWTSGDSTLHGQNDRVRSDIAARLTGSLLLVDPAQLAVHVVSEGAGFSSSRRRIRAVFCYLGTRYNLVVTDPAAEKSFLAKPNGVYPLDSAFLCVSLSETHKDGYCYKLVAAIIGQEPF